MKVQIRSFGPYIKCYFPLRVVAQGSFMVGWCSTSREMTGGVGMCRVSMHHGVSLICPTRTVKTPNLFNQRANSLPKKTKCLRSFSFLHDAFPSAEHMYILPTLPRAYVVIVQRCKNVCRGRVAVIVNMCTVCVCV